LYRTGKVVGQFCRCSTFVRFCTNHPVDIQQFIHKLLASLKTVLQFFCWLIEFFLEKSRNFKIGKPRFFGQELRGGFDFSVDLFT
jgi:hypothetical protein